MTFPIDPNTPGRPRRSEYVRAAVAGGAPPGASAHHPGAALTIRLACVGDDDGPAVEQLAALDDARPPYGPVMLAELGGEPVAAVGIAHGEVVANRSRAGSAIVTLLQLHRLEIRLIGGIWGL
jgi:hypothetical protein